MVDRIASSILGAHSGLRSSARIHKGRFDQIEPSIRKRLEWGASLGPEEIDSMRGRHQSFRTRMDALLAEHELLLLPAAPLARLDAGADHSQARTRIIRYTAPFSLAGVPVVTIPVRGGRNATSLRRWDATSACSRSRRN